jgi:TolB-like protein
MSPRTIAVAPFRNVGSGNFASLGRALESMLIDNLAHLPGVRVLDRDDVNVLIEGARHSGSDQAAEDAATRAGTLLTGGSQLTDWTQSPTHLRLEALLVDVDAGTTIASAQSEALATEFYRLVPEVAGQFASALGQPLDALPPDVSQKIEQPDTKSIKAALLFGEALDALDRKDIEAAQKACKALENEDADFPLAKRKCAYIPLEWLALPSVESAVKGESPAAVSEELPEQATEPSSYKKYALLGLLVLLLIGAGAGGYVLSQGGGGSGAPLNPASPPAVNNQPSLQGVSDRSVQAGGTAAIDMQCFDPDGTASSIQNTNAGPNSSFDQAAGSPGVAHYRQPTNVDQAGQVFNVAFVCTDSGNPPASDTKTARISVLAFFTETASPIPTATSAPGPTSAPTRTPTATSNPTASSSSSPSPRPTPTPSKAPTPSPSPSPRPTPTPSKAPTPSPSPSPPRPTPTPTATPTASPSPPRPTPTPSPTLR